MSANYHFDFIGSKFKLSFMHIFFIFYKNFCNKIVLLNSPTSFICVDVTRDVRLVAQESNCAICEFLPLKSMRQVSTNDIKFCIKNLKNQSSPLKHRIIEWSLSTDHPQVNVIYYLESFISILASVYDTGEQNICFCTQTTVWWKMMFHKLPDEAKTSLSSMIPCVPP